MEGLVLFLIGFCGGQADLTCSATPINEYQIEVRQYNLGYKEPNSCSLFSFDPVVRQILMTDKCPTEHENTKEF